MLEVRVSYSRNKGRAESTEARNPRGQGFSTTLQSKLIFEVYGVKCSEERYFFALKYHSYVALDRS